MSEKTHEHPWSLAMHIYCKADDKLARRKAFSMIRTGLNKGMSPKEIWNAYKWNSYFLKAVHDEKNLARLIEKSQDWDWYKNRVRSVWDVINQIHAVEHSRARSEFRSVAPVLLFLAAMHTSRDVNRNALLAYRYTCKLAKVLFGLDLDPNHLGRKWESLAKKGYINFQKGQQGGSSSRVEVLAYEAEALTKEQRLETVRRLLSRLEESPLKEALSRMLLKLAEMTEKPSYNDDDLENEISATLEIFKVVTKEVQAERTAERLIESVDFAADQILFAEIAQIQREKATERVESFFNSGFSLTEDNRSDSEEIDWSAVLV